MPATIKTEVRKQATPSEAVEPAAREIAMKAADAGYEVALERVPYGATGELQRGLHPPEEQPDGSVWIWSSAPHTLPVEFGSRPHWPPIAPLKHWARIVLGDESAAYAVQHAIAQRGTPAQPFMRPAAERIRQFLSATQFRVTVQKYLPP